MCSQTLKKEQKLVLVLDNFSSQNDVQLFRYDFTDLQFYLLK